MKKQLLVALMATILFSGCKDEAKSPVAVNINAEVSDNDFWEKSDFIGIHVPKAGTSDIVENMENRKYTTIIADNKFTPATPDQTIHFPSDGSNVDVLAYYPHTTKFNDLGAIIIDVNDQTDPAAINF